MKRRSKAVVIAGVLLVGLSTFFFAPVFYWFPYEIPAQTSSGQPLVLSQVYHSLGCSLLGFGDTYYTGDVQLAFNAPAISGFVFSCAPPIELG